MESYQRAFKISSYYEQGYKNLIPIIRMRGKWLAEAGFIIDSYILVTIEHGRLEIIRDGYKDNKNQ